MSFTDDFLTVDFYVTEVRQERIDVTSMEGPARSVEGDTFVTFRSDTGDEFDLRWTNRSEPRPTVGTACRLYIDSPTS